MTSSVTWYELVQKMPVVDVAGRDVEAAGDRQHHLAVAVGVEVPHAQIERIEERRAAAVDRRPVERHAQRVDHVGAEDQRVADRQRLGEVVEARRRRASVSTSPVCAYGAGALSNVYM